MSGKTPEMKRRLQNSSRDISPIRPELVETTDDELCYSLIRFVLEVKKQNGDDSPTETIYDLVISYIAMQGTEVNFLQDAVFVPLRNTVDR